MSKSVLEIAVETGQWTGGLKKAQSALQNFTQASGSTSDAISKSGDKMAQFVSRMGNMESKVKTATGRLKEMENVYKELAVQYKQLTDQERQTPYGKALNQSLSQLQTRIKSARVDIQSVNAELGTGSNGMGDAMPQLAGKMGLPIASLSKLSVGLAAASAALKVAGDAFKHNEVLMDDWNGTIEGAQSIYEGFLVSLNTGDFTGFFSRMGAIAAAAREAYDAMDKLQTYNAFNQINMAGARVGLTEALAGYRTGEFTKAQVEAAAKEMKTQLETRQTMEQEAYLKNINKKATAAGVSSELLAQYLQGSYGDYEKVKATQMPTKKVWNSSTRSMMEEYDREAATPLQKIGEMLRQLNDDELNSLQALGAQANNTANEIAQVDKQTARVFGQKKGGGKTGDVRKTVMAINADVVRGLQEQPIADAIRQQFDGKPIPVQVDVVEAEEVGDDSVILKNLNERYAAIQKINEGIEEMNIILASNADAGTKAWASAQIETYQTQLDSLNGILKETAESIAEIPSAMEQMQTGIGAMESVVGSIDRVRNAFKNMTETMQEDGDVWDKMMSVYDAGMSVLTGVVGVMETINTLTEMSTALKAASTAATATDTASLGAHATAETVDAAATAVTATAEGADAAAKAGKAVSWIPIVGPVLAVAAIASVAAAIAASRSKTEYHADGGFAGMMQPRGTDVVPAMLTPGELVLNRAQQRNLAGQLAGTAGPQTVVVTGRISGRDILLAADADNRARGGSRGAYARTR